MKIYTKTGDEGTTGLIGGARVSKSHPRVEAYGTVDELISNISLLRCEVDNNTESLLKHIESELMLVAAHFANEGGKSIRMVDEGEILILEKAIDIMLEKLPAQNSFILPGGSKASAIAHISRSVCRRAERRAVVLLNSDENIDLSVKYLNRLSDYLFVLARFLNFNENKEEDYWFQ